MKRSTPGTAVPPCSGVWVYGDARVEPTRHATASLLGLASGLARKRGCPLGLVLLGRQIEPALEFFRGLAPDRIYVVAHPRLERYRQETYTAVLTHLARRFQPEIFLFLANDCGRELAPRLAARLGTGLCADCVALDIDAQSGLLVQTVPAFGDNVYGRIVTPEKRPQMATVRPGILSGSPEEAGSGTGRGTGTLPEIIRIGFPRDEVRERVRWLGEERVRGPEAPLEEARAVVCGGRGMGNARRFGTLWDLARLLGAEVGATRPAVHAHWIDEDRMVGQTGRAVAPEVLLAFGISGATQFAAAIQRSRYIVAVNRDPKAAIFSMADLGIVGDAGQVLSELIPRLRRLLIERYGMDAGETDAQGGAAGKEGLGGRLRALREKRGYGVSEAAQALEIGPRDLERIEANEASPSVSLLLRLARLYRVDPAAFLTAADGARADRRRVESFTKRTQTYSYQTLTPGAERKHLRAFRVTIDPRRAHKMIEYKHEGEEFVYVLRGEVEIKVGEDLHLLKRGESLHFEASIPHHLRNPSGQRAEMIVVLYTP